MKRIYTLIAAMLLALTSFSQQYAILDGGTGTKDTLTTSVHYTSDTIYYCSSVTITTYGSLGDTLLWDFKNPDIFFPSDTEDWFHDTVLVSPPDSTWFALNGASRKFYFVKKFPTSKICWVTVDSNFAHNVIIWDTTGFVSEGIDSIKVYYYYTITHLKLLATEPRIGNTYYVDSVNNPNSGTFKYLLAGVNSCGNQDTNSAWQTTAWIQQTGSTFTVSSPYTVKGDAAPVSYYILYRDTTGTGYNWDSIFSTPGTILNDPNYSNYPSAKYYVAAVLNLPGCAAPAITHRLESAAANKSKSNRLTNQVTGIASIDKTIILSFSPNPSNGQFVVRVNGLTGRSTLRIYNVLGQEVYNTTIMNGTNPVNMSGRSSGLYIYKLQGEDGKNQGSGKLTIE